MFSIQSVIVNWAVPCLRQARCSSQYYFLLLHLTGLRSFGLVTASLCRLVVRKGREFQTGIHTDEGVEKNKDNILMSDFPPQKISIINLRIAREFSIAAIIKQNLL